MPLLENIFLQTETGAAIIIAVLAAIIISAIFYGAQRRSISSINQRLTTLAQIDPKIQFEVSDMQTRLQNVFTDLTTLKTELPHTFIELRCVFPNAFQNSISLYSRPSSTNSCFKFSGIFGAIRINLESDLPVFSS